MLTNVLHLPSQKKMSSVRKSIIMILIHEKNMKSDLESFLTDHALDVICLKIVISVLSSHFIEFVKATECYVEKIFIPKICSTFEMSALPMHFIQVAKSKEKHNITGSCIFKT